MYLMVATAWRSRGHPTNPVMGVLHEAPSPLLTSLIVGLMRRITNGNAGSNGWSGGTEGKGVATGSWVLWPRVALGGGLEGGAMGDTMGCEAFSLRVKSESF